ncbi:hypothetical protein BH23ACT9_BH23ACT9_28560 [soil metagenome]
MTLQSTDFSIFFAGVHGADVIPFAWQLALLDQVVDTGWPEVIDVPTGMGKTAVVDIALFALALQAELPPSARTAPTRTFVIVDRRLIVDQTHDHARQVARALRRALIRDEGVISEVARRLQSLSVGTQDPRPLDVVRMRGGISWDARWLDSPAQPAVITGTVDQLGSRALFRGYGVTEHARPIDAALVGTDRLLILDEAHLAWPLVQTLRAVAAREARATTSMMDPRRCPPPVLLSATPPLGEGAPTRIFRLDAALETSPTARQRLGVQRQTRLVELKTTAKADQDEALVTAFTALSAEMLQDGLPSLLVIANTVALARKTFDRLSGDPIADTADLALLVGRARPLDKDRIVRDVLIRRLGAGQQVGDGARPLVLVATQTVEVGADIDVAGLITEAAPIDALLQRLGRLDRRGQRLTSTAVAVHSGIRHAEAPVYGAATDRTWAWLCEQAGTPTPIKPEAAATSLADALWLDLGPAALAVRLDPPTRSSLASEATPAPVLLGPVIDAWAQTSPTPDPDQDVAPFLHGIQRARAEVSICWRAGLAPPSTAEATEAWREEIRTAPPTAHEQVAVPIGEARRFLGGAAAPGGADIEGALDEDDWSDDGGRRTPDGVIVSVDGTVRRLSPDIRPGETAVLTASSGGYDRWGWTGVPDGSSVADVADLGTGGRPRLRLRPAVLDLLLGQGATTGSGLVGRPDGPEFDAADCLQRIGVAAAALAVVEKSADDQRMADTYGQELAAVCEVLARGPLLVRSANHHVSEGGWLVVEGRRTGRGARASADVGDGIDDDDRSAVVSSTTSVPIDLDRHLRDVEHRARGIAVVLGLAEDVVATLGLAGLAHDLGKADPRFQSMLYGGDSLRAEATGRLLAKSGMAQDDPAAFRLAARRSGLPQGFRHEAVSARLISGLLDADPALGTGLDRDLLVHLVGAHHGRGRPMPGPVLDDHPEEVEIGLPGHSSTAVVRTEGIGVDWDAPGRFRRLGAQYGWWGLALLETVLRLADMEVSREYDAGGGPTGTWVSIVEGEVA